MNVSILQIFEYLHATCGNLTDLDLQQNEEKMRQPWNQKQPIENKIYQLEGAIDYAEHVNSPFTKNQTLSVACVVMDQAKVFKEPRREWRRKPQAEKI